MESLEKSAQAALIGGDKDLRDFSHYASQGLEKKSRVLRRRAEQGDEQALQELLSETSLGDINAGRQLAELARREKTAEERAEQGLDPTIEEIKIPGMLAAAQFYFSTTRTIGKYPRGVWSKAKSLDLDLVVQQAFPPYRPMLPSFAKDLLGRFASLGHTESYDILFAHYSSPKVPAVKRVPLLAGLAGKRALEELKTMEVKELIDDAYYYDPSLRGNLRYQSSRPAFSKYSYAVLSSLYGKYGNENVLAAMAKATKEHKDARLDFSELLREYPEATSELEKTDPQLLDRIIAEREKWLQDISSEVPPPDKPTKKK